MRQKNCISDHFLFLHHGTQENQLGFLCLSSNICVYTYQLGSKLLCEYNIAFWTNFVFFTLVPWLTNYNISLSLNVCVCTHNIHTVVLLKLIMYPPHSGIARGIGPIGRMRGGVHSYFFHNSHYYINSIY
jgi:hypothetical protein